MKYFILILESSLLLACSHTINFRANHFAVPVVGENQWSGTFAGVGTSVTKITVINDINSNPPYRSSVDVNKNVNSSDFLMLNNVGVDASISLIKSLELYYDNPLLGLRWQILNHGSASNVWSAAIQGAYGTKDSTTSDVVSGGVTSEAKSKVKTTQAGVSIGYKATGFVPYISFIRENHDVETRVTNSSGNFGPYKDTGVHDYLSIGISTTGKGFLGAIEYSMINIKWDRAEAGYQNALGGKIGFAW